MHEVTADENKLQLAELVDAALRGERVVIARDDQHAVQLMPVARAGRGRHSGTARELIVMSADFDAPLTDFDDYMP